MRARALRIGGAAGVTAVALGTVGAAGIGFSGLGSSPEPSPSASVDLSIESTVEYATVPFPEEPYGQGFEVAMGRCGEAIPQYGMGDEDFAFSSSSPTELELDPASAGFPSSEPDVATALTYRGAEEMRAFVERPRAYLLRDGVVVGWEAWGQDPELTTLNPGRTVEYPWEWGGYFVGCGEGDEYGQVEPGDYQMMVVMDVYNDAQSAATHSLWMEGYVLPPRADAPAFREGGFECQDAQMYFGATPLTCVPNALPGVEFDYEAGTATVPYESEYYSRDVDLAFVTGPIEVTLLDEPEPDFPDEPEPPYYEPGTEVACGNVFADNWYGALEGVWDDTISDVSAIAEGEVLRPSLWRRDLGWSSAEVELPESPRLWAVQREEIELDYGDGSSVIYEGLKVVGWIDTVASEGSSVTIDRYVGPAEWPLTVTDTGWCEGEGQLGTFAGVFIAEPAAITAQPDGVRDELDTISLQPRDSLYFS